MNSNSVMAVKWHLIYDKYQLQMAEIKYPYTEPHLNDYDGDMGKSWVITFWI